MTETPRDPQREAATHPPPEAAAARSAGDGATHPAPATAVAQAAGDGAGAAAGGGFGLPVAVALIMGSIIGVGIFNLPTSLAGIGPITLVSMALTTVGAIALALMFAALSRRLPADGGPYAYSRAAFGNVVGFFNAWSYWITAWAGNAGIAVGWVLYVEVFINKGQNKLITVLLVLVGLWIPAIINLSGVKNMGSVQMVTTILKFAALLFVSIVGLFYIKSANFTPWNVSGQGAISAIGAGMAIALFSYLGVEVASVAAGKVRDPDRNVPRSTVLGTLACAVVYLLSLIAVFGIVPNGTLQKSTAPFSTAVNAMFGGTWAGYVMAVVVIISGFGALNGWTMICAEMPLAAAKDGLFPGAVPAHFKKRGADVRNHRLHRAGIDCHGHQLPRLRRRPGLHHTGADDRHYLRHSVRVLRAGADQMADRGPQDHARPAVRPRYGHCRRGAGVLDPVHLVLAQHRRQRLPVLVAVRAGRSRAPARHPRLLRAAGKDDRARTRAGVPLTGSGPALQLRDGLDGQLVQAGEHQPGRAQRGGLRRVPRVRDGDDLQARGRRGTQPVG